MVLSRGEGLPGRVWGDGVADQASFVTGMATDLRDAALVRPAVTLGHSLGLAVVAEGVEDRATWQLLAEYECDLAQGYFLTRPLPTGELEEWLSNSPWGLWTEDSAPVPGGAAP